MYKVTGTVKWFSNKKGFGFISPTSPNCPTEEEIFVHQTSIFSDGAYRTLTENAEVEFEVEKEAESGKYKAINVTAPGGGSIKPPTRERRRNDGRRGDLQDDTKEDSGEAYAPTSGTTEEKGAADGRQQGRNNRRGAARKTGDAVKRTERVDNGGERKEAEPPFHDKINDDVKEKIKGHGIELGRKSTVDIAYGDARIKLGQGGYAGLALANGVVGEGTYSCDEKGVVSFDWKRALTFSDGAWTPSGPEQLIKSLSLGDDAIEPVKQDETPETLWGADKTDPKDAFESNGFQMRRVVLTRPPGFRGRRGGGGPKN